MFKIKEHDSNILADSGMFGGSSFGNPGFPKPSLPKPFMIKPNDTIEEIEQRGSESYATLEES